MTATAPAAIAQVALAHAALVEHVEALGGAGADPAAPSALPGWTRGHLLTHLARNADSLVRILEGVERGERRDQYVGGAAGRNAAIEAGAGRTWAELATDVRAASAALDAQMAGQRRWDGEGVGGTGTAVPATDVPFRRWREVVVHRADLGDPAFTARDWPTEYVREELRQLTMRWNARLPMGGTGLPPAALAAPELARLLWLMGRGEIPGLDPAGIFP